jgi:hypothetical protein
MCDAGTPTTRQCTGAGRDCPASRPRVGSACTQEGTSCAYGNCNDPFERCTQGTWHTERSSCPVSSRRYKKEISYLEEQDLQALADRTLSTRLATYRYISGDPATHLGFIIEDDPSSPGVLQGKDRVDLYGYTSMAVATLQVQSREIADLRREVEQLRKAVANAPCAH